MPASKVKTAAPADGAAGASKAKGGAKSSRSGTGTSTPIPPPQADELHETTATSTGLGRPDKVAYDAEQEKIKKEIDTVQVKLVCLTHTHLFEFDFTKLIRVAVCCEGQNIAGY